MANSVVGALRVTLGLDSAQFERGANRAQGAAGRLGSALRRFAQIAGAAAAAALTALTARSLQTIDAQAKLAQSLGTTVESVQVLTRAGELAGLSMGEIEQATRQLTRRLSQAAAGSGPAVDALERLQLSATELAAIPLDQRVSQIQDAIQEFIPPTQRAAVAAQIFGDRAGLLFSRIDSETLRTASEDLRRFGVIVSEQDADQIERTNDAVSRLGLIGTGVGNQLAVAFAPAIEAIADGLARLFEVTGPAGRAIAFLGENIGRIATTAATAAAIFAGRWVVAMAAAAGATGLLSGALLVLRGALIRTGIGALIVLLGEAVFQILRLKDLIGSWAETFTFLGQVAQEVLGRIPAGFDLIVQRGTEKFNRLVQIIANAMREGLQAVVEFGNSAVNTMEGTVAAIGEYWGALPGIVGEAAVNAANAAINAMDGLLGKAAAGLNRLIEAANAVPGVDIGTVQEGGFLDEIENTFSGAMSNAGASARAAFDNAFNSEPFNASSITQGLSEIGAAAVQSQIDARLAGDAAAEAFFAPIQAIELLRQRIAEAQETAAEPEQWAAAAAALDEVAAAAGRAGGAAREAASEVANVGEQAETSGELAQTLASGLAGALVDAITGTRSLRESLAQLAKQLANQLLTRFFNSLFSGGLGGGGGGFLGGLFGRNAVGTSNWQGGLSLVGERGPEIVSMPRGSKVFDHNRSMSMMQRMMPEQAAPNVSVTPRIVNVFDPRIVGDFVSSPEGEQAIVNVIQRNRGLLGG